MLKEWPLSKSPVVVIIEKGINVVTWIMIQTFGCGCGWVGGGREGDDVEQLKDDPYLHRAPFRRGCDPPRPRPVLLASHSSGWRSCYQEKGRHLHHEIEERRSNEET